MRSEAVTIVLVVRLDIGRVRLWPGCAARRRAQGAMVSCPAGLKGGHL
jgi:hypothetical protein